MGLIIFFSDNLLIYVKDPKLPGLWAGLSKDDCYSPGINNRQTPGNKI